MFQLIPKKTYIIAHKFNDFNKDNNRVMVKQIAYLINVKVKRPSFSRYLTNFATASGCCCDQSQSSAAGSLDDNSCLMESSNGDARCIILHNS